MGQKSERTKEFLGLSISKEGGLERSQRNLTFHRHPAIGAMPVASRYGLPSLSIFKVYELHTLQKQVPPVSSFGSNSVPPLFLMNTGKGYHFVCLHTVQTALLSSRKVQAFRSQTMASDTPLFREQLVNGGLAVERMRNGQRWWGNTSPS